MTGSHRRVGREYATLADARRCFGKIDFVSLDSLPSKFQRQESGVAFIEMKDRRLNLQVVQQADTPNSERHFLYQTRFPIAAVKMTSNQAIDLFILADIRVEQIKLNPADVCLPGVRANGSPTHRDFNMQRDSLARSQ